MSKAFELFKTFFKIGAFTFGGGYAMIPIIQQEVVENKKWLQEQDVMDVIAIAESTPGPLAINTATFVGYKVAGVKGAFFSTLGVVIPSFVIIVLIAFLFQPYMKYPVVENAFWGVRIAVLALMVKALINMYKQCPKKAVSYFVSLAGFIAVACFAVNVLYVVIGAALVGIIYNSVRRRDK